MTTSGASKKVLGP